MEAGSARTHMGEMLIQPLQYSQLVSHNEAAENLRADLSSKVEKSFQHQVGEISTLSFAAALALIAWNCCHIKHSSLSNLL